MPAFHLLFICWKQSNRELRWCLLSFEILNCWLVNFKLPHLTVSPSAAHRLGVLNAPSTPQTGDNVAKVPGRRKLRCGYCGNDVQPHFAPTPSHRQPPEVTHLGLFLSRGRENEAPSTERRPHIGDMAKGNPRSGYRPGMECWWRFIYFHTLPRKSADPVLWNSGDDEDILFNFK